jgi:HNH endonuclease
VTDALRALVESRANFACEYCHLPRDLAPLQFELDHILARQHGGATTLENLAFICQNCNLHKGPNIAGLDPATGRMTRLYHPRSDVWQEHFRWAGHELIGLSDVGRSTIRVLNMNSHVLMVIRATLLMEGLFPPLPGQV